jgi:hypothetical protein
MLWSKIATQFLSAPRNGRPAKTTDHVTVESRLIDTAPPTCRTCGAHATEVRYIRETRIERFREGVVSSKTTEEVERICIICERAEHNCTCKSVT